MNIDKILYVVAAALLCLSCAKEKDPQTEPGKEKDAAGFTAFAEALTKTSISDDFLSVVWTKGDKVSLITGGENSLFTVDKDGASSRLSSESVVEKGVESIWGVYPYAEEYVVSGDGKTLAATVGNTLKFREPGIADGLNISVAYLTEVESENELDFCNVLSYVLVDIPDSERIVEFTLKSEPETDLAGNVKIVMENEGTPAIVEVSDGQTAVTASSEYPFDGKYLIPVIPQSSPATYVLDVKHVDGTAESGWLVSDGEVILRRNRKISLVKPAPDPVAAPVISVTNAFWSDAIISIILPAGAQNVKAVLDGSEAGDVTGNTFRFTGLDCGTEYRVKVTASVKGNVLESNEVTFTTGNIRQLTRNISPTSVAVGIENRAGALSGNYKPCLYVQLFESEDVSDTPKYEAFVRDNEVLSEGHPFYKSLVAGSGMTYPPFNLAFGGLEPWKDYWFRVKSVKSDTYITYRAESLAGKEYSMESQNGDSEYSKLVKLSTSGRHAPGADEVLFEGFDDCFFSADFINCAVGLMPAIRTKAEKFNPSTAFTPSDWTGWTGPWCFYGLRTGLNGTSTTALNWWTKQVGDKKITFDGTEALAVRYWVTTADGILLAPASVAGEKLGPVKKDKGMLSLGDASKWFMTGNTAVGEGYLVLSRLYGSDDKVNAAPGGIFTPPLSSVLLNTTEKSKCIISFKALAVQGVSGRVKVLRLDRNANHREATSDLWEEVAEIKIANSNGNVDENASEWSAQSETHRWYDYSCEVDLLRGDLIGFTSDGSACVCIDNIEITREQ